MLPIHQSLEGSKIRLVFSIYYPVDKRETWISCLRAADLTLTPQCPFPPLLPYSCPSWKYILACKQEEGYALIKSTFFISLKHFKQKNARKYETRSSWSIKLKATSPHLHPILLSRVIHHLVYSRTAFIKWISKYEAKLYLPIRIRHCWWAKCSGSSSSLFHPSGLL